MTASSDRESATIYQFPLRGRFAATRREEMNATLAPQQVAKVAVGSGWYHEAAIQEDESTREP